MKNVVIGLGLAVAALGSAAQAFPGQTDSFVHEKSGYVVQTREAGGGVRYIAGRHPATGETFRLKVLPSGRVTGTFAGKPVELAVGNGARAQLALSGVGAK